MSTICAVTQSSSALLLDPRHLRGPVIRDIRKSVELLDLRSCVLSGLSQPRKAIPSLLLWDEQGLENFNEWTRCPHYYPKSKEIEILETCNDKIAAAMPHKSSIVELGCGNLHKTSVILSALAKQKKEVHYYALDVSQSALLNNLQALQEEFKCFPKISISGLLGTYDDCVDWISNNDATLHALPVTFLWVGNSVANLSKSEASNLMAGFRQACSVARIDCRFLVSADACADEGKLTKAYNPESGSSRTFLRHGLNHVNRLFNTDLFDGATWNCTVEYDREENEVLAFYFPVIDVTFPIDDTGSVTVHQGEHIFFFRSGKWNQEQMGTVARQSGFQVSRVWRDLDEEYGFYFLTP
ncbi:N-methyltransferase fsqC [Aspergillus homomorphus CBS 101889]|uniref:Histidine-specific methyltransferase SAM-dependent domain-containing protein n=1 Tax=Aspergillus homomorphus (strain CBS 101889) TaxID=1450537 RepID=A0A395IA40_ASPHC|nr:hypothetical protein BO97DRAFT_430947 [Aspergillus homomorphus CBS 101889]RAL16896.1 hypothetical protein BO97DRAFT_430947 [Aspergillus homomorphus CBS 101889]